MLVPFECVQRCIGLAHQAESKRFDTMPYVAVSLECDTVLCIVSVLACFLS